VGEALAQVVAAARQVHLAVAQPVLVADTARSRQEVMEDERVTPRLRVAQDVQQGEQLKAQAQASAGVLAGRFADGQ